MREETLPLSPWSVRFNKLLGKIFSHKFTAGNTENQEGMEESVFVCKPGNEVSISALCDGINDCGFGNDETTALCESQSPPSLCL